MKTFSELVKRASKVVVLFSGRWCQSCTPVDVMLKGLCKDSSSVEYEKIYAEDYQDEATRLGIKSLPTAVFFVDGHLANSVGTGGRIVGVHEQQHFEFALSEFEAL